MATSRQETPDILGAALTGGGRALRQLRATEIRQDGGTQPRAGVDSRYVQELAADIENGALLPPLDVTYDGSHYWLWDGYHRLAAWRKVRGDGVLLDVRVHQGSQADAQWASYAANKGHGLRRTNEDKQRSVVAALKHPNGAARSNRDIARYLGVDEGTVRHWREKLEAGAEIPQVSERMGADGKTYSTGGIGRTSLAGRLERAVQQQQAAQQATARAATLDECIAAVWANVKNQASSPGDRLNILERLDWRHVSFPKEKGVTVESDLMIRAIRTVTAEVRGEVEREVKKEARRAVLGGGGSSSATSAASVAQPGQAEPTTGDERTEELHRLKLTFMHSMDALTLWAELTGRHSEVIEAKRGLRKVIDRTSDLIDGKAEESEEVSG